MGIDPGSLAVKAALMAVQMGLQMTQKIKGPRLKSRDVTTADFGTPLERFWGKRRLLGRPIIHAEKLREKKTTSKTKGGKYSEYKYFGTFAVAVADQEIESISRIWMDKHLVYDMTNTGPISVLGAFFMGLQGSPVKIRNGKNMRIYLGTETQTPDPRYEAWTEDRYGPDTAPAYRGVSYIFFEDIPLEKFGNRIPQIDVEAISLSNDNYLWDTETTTASSGIAFSPDYSRFYADGSLWDTVTRSRLATLSFVPAAVGSSGVLYDVTNTLGQDGGPYFWRVTSDGQTAADPLACPQICSTATALPSGRVFLGSSISNYVQYPSGALVVAIDVGFRPTSFAEDSELNTWAAGNPSGVDDVSVYCVAGTRMGESHTISGTGSTDFVNMWINSRDEFVLEQDGNLWRVDNAFNVLQTGTITATGTFTTSWGSDKLYRVATTTVSEYSLLDLSLIRTIAQSSWSGAPGNIAGTFGAAYDPVTHSIMTCNSGTLVSRYLDRVDSSGVDLGDVVSDVAGWCGLTDVDVTDLDQIVQGYSVVQGTGKDMIGPLLDIHDVDARPHDFGVQFLTRGNAAISTIPVSEFVREGDEARYRITITQDTDLPRQVTLSYADQDKEQQTNTVVAQRPLDAVDSVRTQQIDLTTYVGTPGDMQKALDRYFRAQWNRREKVENALTAQYLGVEPADVYTLQLDGVTWTGKVEKVTLSQGRLNVEWARDETGLHTLGSGTGADQDARDPDVILIPSPTKGLVKDIPLTEDAHASDLPLLYYGAGDYPGGTFWPGATIFEGDTDGDDYLPWKPVEPADKATWGYATDALGDADPWLWDRGNSVNVTSNAALVTVTEAEIDADPTLNLAMLGTELINFTTATLESDGSYTLSGFKRGRRGTEWACPDHLRGEEFVLISTLATDGIGLSDVGLELFYKATTIGRDIVESPAIEIDFNGNTLRPYAPARIKWTTDGTDLFGEIIRRTRVGGAWVGGTTIPLSEASEEYEVDIYHLTTFKRTITVSGTNTFTYTAAQISADSNSVGTPPPVNVYQMSDAVGRGFALAA